MEENDKYVLQFAVYKIIFVYKVGEELSKGAP
jgi:hypothetical protein